MEFSSKILEKAVNAFATLPGVGKKTALRHVLHLIKQNDEDVNVFIEALQELKDDLTFCKNCHNISETEVCHICSNQARDQSTMCIVQDFRDVIAIERTGLYKGSYHILGGLISPMDGIGPSDLNIDTLLEKVSKGTVKEVIFAINATMEGETTSFFLFKKLAPYSLEISAIARGIAVGEELEYTDEVTLARSIQQRIPFSDSIKS
ncbi:MAG: recombination mediator RecR [Bacteroidia bacterium]